MKLKNADQILARIDLVNRIRHEVNSRPFSMSQQMLSTEMLSEEIALEWVLSDE